ncbi:endonuclease/exonuclease/phosphatase family protein [Iningainema tapete]|uniref:Endonuclease/exonuclease/phosphatase domain-containing protein n=1 Tax=Iningainema tapete BLCC-T55 TaxID=2748662 RepID=A0A8J6XX33_9CYAN|nr:endonuclease/exonuclease/phosphatase family protein [Iningainema tapete]MBD2777952.1 hypothetical protein [Iningainema tapete BLCC-T55]
MVKVVTINILYDLQDWEQRRTLLVDGLATEQADLIALQEVKLPENTAHELAQLLGMPYVHLVPRQVKLGVHIFVNQHIQVRDCQIILNQPAPSSSTLYPSDHFGIAAVLEIAS